jgi:protein-disulfide isomerase
MAKRPDPAVEDRRRQARAAQQAALARAKRRRTLTQLAIVGGVAVVVIAIIATAVILGTRGKDTPAAAAGGPVATATTTVDGTSVPFTIGGAGDTANGVRVGAADAKVTMDLWVDYSCPHCQEFEATNDAALTSLVASGKLAVVYHNIQIVTDYGTEAGSASACLAVHDPNAWPAFNAALYANHSAATDGWTASDFARFATANGGGSATRSCITDGTYRSWISANTEASATAGVSGTPTMFIDGQKTDTLSGSDLTDRVNSLAGA